MLGEVEDIVVREKSSDTRSKGEEEEISKEENKRAIAKPKDGKAAKMDRIPNEV